MAMIPKKRSESVFADFKLAYSDTQAATEANRCLYCSDAPCIAACPTGINIPEFIRKIATGNTKGSARTIFSANILGMSCARVCPVETLCVGDCVYHKMDLPPIQIGKLQRYATDQALDAGWRFFEAGSDTKKSVALVGAGPATMACAHALRRAGHGCAVYEKRQVPGGLNTTGVAPYKMRADRSLAEVDWIMGIGGIEMTLGVEIGADVSWADLEAKHDAIFIGMGLGLDSRLDVAGQDLEGVHGAVHFIEQLKLGQVDLSHVEHAVVIGGGNTAVDAVRELKGLGVPHVTMAYRGREAMMSGYAHEWKVAKVENVNSAWGLQPIEFIESKGRVSGVRCAELDANKAPTGGERVLDCQLVLLAIGQSKLGSILGGLEGISLDRGRVITDEGGRTGRPGYFAGGDCANGGKEVVNAVAEGKIAAESIDLWLQNNSLRGDV